MFRDIFCFFSYFSFWKCKNEAVILKLLTVVYLVFTEFPNLQLFNFDTLWKMENNYFNNKLSFSIKIGLGFENSNSTNSLLINELKNSRA